MLANILTWFREQLMAEGSVIRKAPITFVFATVILSTLLAAGAYSVLLSVKNDQIAFYRERLGELPTPKARYSLMRNDQLKQSAISFSGRLRDRIAIFEKRRDDIESKRMIELLNGTNFNPMSPTKEGKAAFEQVLKTTTQMAGDVVVDSVNEYERQFRSDAIAMRDELEARLPVGITKADPITYLTAPGGLFGGRQVADDIDRLARMLP